MSPGEEHIRRSNCGQFKMQMDKTRLTLWMLMQYEWTPLFINGDALTLFMYTIFCTSTVLLCTLCMYECGAEFCKPLLWIPVVTLRWYQPRFIRFFFGMHSETYRRLNDGNKFIKIMLLTFCVFLQRRRIKFSNWA